MQLARFQQDSTEVKHSRVFEPEPIQEELCPVIARLNKLFDAGELERTSNVKVVLTNEIEFTSYRPEDAIREIEEIEEVSRIGVETLLTSEIEVKVLIREAWIRGELNYVGLDSQLETRWSKLFEQNKLTPYEPEEMIDGFEAPDIFDEQHEGNSESDNERLLTNFGLFYT